MPDGRVDVKGRVAEWSPPHRLAVTWTVDWIEDMRDLPECLVTYEIAQAGESVRLTMTEAHQWDVPDDLLSGGRAGWPAILSSLKSVLETGKPLSLKMEPPKEMMDGGATGDSTEAVAQMMPAARSRSRADAERFCPAVRSFPRPWMSDIICGDGTLDVHGPMRCRSYAPKKSDRVGARVFAAVGALLCLEASVVSAARAQSSQSGSTGTINLGVRGWSASETTSAPSTDRAADELEFSVRAGIASDYIYRGTTLSDRKPAIGAAAEAALASFYAGIAVASVRLPTQPAAEITMTGGVRRTIGNINLDFGVTYFAYPGETMPGRPMASTIGSCPPALIPGSAKRSASPADSPTPPNVSKTGAWGQYAAAGIGFDVPSRLLPQDVDVSFTGGAGYSWFGNQAAALGGFPLPAYLDWQAGVTITRKMFNLDLRYYDTNLSKENCFVFTGDPNARPGGRADPVTNPDGLTSRWCGATFVAKIWFELN